MNKELKISSNFISLLSKWHFVCFCCSSEKSVSILQCSFSFEECVSFFFLLAAFMVFTFSLVSSSLMMYVGEILLEFIGLPESLAECVLSALENSQVLL